MAVILFWFLSAFIVEILIIVLSRKMIGRRAFIFNLIVGGLAGIIVGAILPIDSSCFIGNGIYHRLATISCTFVFGLLPMSTLTFICVEWQSAKQDPWSLLNCIRRKILRKIGK